MKANRRYKHANQVTLTLLKGRITGKPLNLMVKVIIEIGHRTPNLEFGVMVLKV